MYKYAIKHFNSVFFSLYRIFDIVQYSVDAVYTAGALFEDRLGLNAGQVCPQTLYFKGFELSQAGAVGRKWYLEREFESSERRKSGKFAQTVSHMVYNSPSGSFQFQSVPEAAS